MVERTKELDNHLKKFRKKANLTQEELAERVGVTRKSINTVENGVFIPTTVLALKLAKVLKVTVEDLFILTGDWA